MAIAAAKARKPAMLRRARVPRGIVAVTLPSISGYTLIESLGAGGFASVYLASKDDTGARFAIKVLHAHSSEQSDLRRFERERTTMRAFNGHPNIVGVFDNGETDGGEQYMVLEYVDGGTIRDRLRAQGAVHWTDVLRISVQLCSALDVAHRSGVLHRDVKPANVLLSEDNAKLSDFGIARLIGQSQVTAAQSIIGTLAYTPPEIFHNSGFDGRGDIYQLGITMYEMLLGRAPFTSAAADNKAMIIRRIIDIPAPSLAPFDIPQPLSDLLDEVLAKDPADRPQSAAGFGERLNAIERELGQTATPMYREPALPGSADTGPGPGGTETIQAPTEALDMEAHLNPDPTIDVGAGLDPTIDVGPASDAPEWPAAAGSTTAAGSVAAAGATAAFVGTEPDVPTPPVVKPPDDVNITVAEPRPEHATSILAKPDLEPAAPPASKSIPTRAPASQGPSTASPASSGTNANRPTGSTATATPPPDESSRSKAPWVLFLIALLLVAGAGAAFALIDSDNGEIDELADDPVDETVVEDVEAVPERVPEFAPIATNVFAQPPGSDGVVFSSVANSQGLTIVGSAGDGERVDEQRSIVWTFGTQGFGVQRDFGDSGVHRMWDIGVIDGETFLAVGDTPGRDGIAWTGDRASELTEVSNADFTGIVDDLLRASVEDTSQPLTFLVGGSRTDLGVAVPGLWEVTGVPSWDDPTWTQIDLGTDAPGVISDIAVEGDIAVAVGSETVDGGEVGTVRIRRGDTWADLIAPQTNTRFWAVAINGDEIIAVGEQNVDTIPTPIAVISDPTGVGLIHPLPLRTDDGVDTGLVRDVAVLDDGTVIAVGNADRRLDPNDGESPTDRDGTIWQFLPDDGTWTTRASADLVVDGFTELWAIDEFDGTTYVFGRTETEDGRQPAGAWTLELG